MRRCHTCARSNPPFRAFSLPSQSREDPMKHETPFRRSRMTAALGLLAALLTVAPAAHASAVPQELTDAAAADPAATFDVIVDSSDATGTAAAATSDVLTAIPADGEGITRRFAVIDGVTAHLSGAQVL